MNLQTLQQNTLDHAKQVLAKRDVSPTTIKDYQTRIGAFLDFAGNDPLSRDLFIAYKRHLLARNDIGAATKDKYFTAARVLLQELYHQGMLPQDVTKGVKSVKVVRDHKKMGLNAAEIKRIARYLKELPTGPEKMRLTALFALYYFQGLRQIEVKRLAIEDISFSQKTMMIKGKGDDDKKLVHLHPTAATMIKRYATFANVKSGPLFPTRNGALSTRTQQWLWRKVFDAVGIDKSKTIHGFRHHFATRMIEVLDGNLVKVRHFTRHRDFKQLVIYNDNLSVKQDLPKFYEAFA